MLLQHVHASKRAEKKNTFVVFFLQSRPSEAAENNRPGAKICYLCQEHAATQ